MSVVAVHAIADLRRRVREARRSGTVIGAVPTMGALHEGHGRLIERARAECGFVVVTVFVNPTQFNDPADYSRYPRTFDVDLAFCEARGADVVFAPAPEEMYPREQQTLVEAGEAAESMEGRFRPGHFRGVATVVAKLLNIVGPDKAYFGEKDAQQVAVVRRMVEDLNFPVEIVEVGTVRESDGLALSSRNARLTADERRVAVALYEALEAAGNCIAGGERRSAEVKRCAAEVFARNPGVRAEYFEVADPVRLTPLERIEGTVRLVGAIWVGQVRLIDNILVVPGAR
ncbi:MAG: pantoate--beta-alanine ligase [Bryobacteraceae bacterium]|jgi:pantoate--beta-alanine ligase